MAWGRIVAVRNPSSIVRSHEEFDIEASLDRLITEARNPLRSISQFGFNPAVGTTPEGIWLVGGPFNFLQAPEAVRIAAGGDVADDIAGVGARTVMIEGIDENLKVATEILSMAGVNASLPTSTKWWRIWRLTVDTVGVYGGFNIGDITTESVDTTTVLSVMAAEGSTSLLAAISTPDNCSMVIRHVLVNIEGSKDVEMKLCVRENYTDVSEPISPVVVARKFIGMTAFHTDTPKSLMVCPPLTDIFFVANTTVGTSGVSVAFDVLLIPII